jgi:hypothetical protein
LSARPAPLVELRPHVDDKQQVRLIQMMEEVLDDVDDLALDVLQRSFRKAPVLGIESYGDKSQVQVLSPEPPPPRRG